MKRIFLLFLAVLCIVPFTQAYVLQNVSNAFCATGTCDSSWTDFANAWDNDESTYAQVVALTPVTTLNATIGHIWETNYSLLNGSVNFQVRMEEQSFSNGNLDLQFYNGSEWYTVNRTILTTNPQVITINYTNTSIVAQGVRLNMSASNGASINFRTNNINYTTTNSSPPAANTSYFQITAQNNYTGQSLTNFSVSFSPGINATSQYNFSILSGSDDNSNVLVSTDGLTAIYNASSSAWVQREALNQLNYTSLTFIFTNETGGTFIIDTLISPVTYYQGPIQNMTFTNVSVPVGEIVRFRCTVSCVGLNLQMNYTYTQNTLSTTNGTIVTGILSNSTTPYNITVDSNQSGEYLSRSYLSYVVNTSGNLLAQINQTMITYRFFNGVDSSPIGSFNLLNANYSKNFSSTNNVTIGPPANQLLNFTFVKAGFGNYQYNATFTGEQISTIDIYLFGLANFTLIDEATNLPFNVSLADLVEWYGICTGETYYIVLNSSTVAADGSFASDAGCNASVYRVVLHFTGFEPYARAVIPNQNQVTATGGNVYVVNLLNTSAVLTTFLSNDLLNTYLGGGLLITKQIGNETVLIHGDYFDAAGKVQTMLIQNAPYFLTVFAQDVPNLLLGNYFADTAGTQVLRLYDISTLPGGLSPQINVTAWFDVLNVSNSTYVVGNFTNPLNTTSQVVFELWLDNIDSGTLLASTTITNNSFQWLVNMTAYENSTVYGFLNATFSNGQTFQLAPLLISPQITRAPVGVIADVGTTFMRWFGLAIVLALGLFATMRTADAMGFFLSLFALVLSMMGFFGTTNIWMNWGITSVCGVLVIFSAINWLRGKASE